MKIILTIILLLSFSSPKITYFANPPLEHSLPDVLAHIKSFEGWHYNNKEYIGYGHLRLKTDKCINPTKAQGDSILKVDIRNYIHAFKDYEDSIALGLMAYNIGIGGVYATGIPKAMKAKESRTKIKEMWMKVTQIKGKSNLGLQRRRRIEIIYFLKD